MMTGKEAITIVSEFIKRQDNSNGATFAHPDNFDQALRIVLDMAWMYEDLHL